MSDTLPFLIAGGLLLAVAAASGGRSSDDDGSSSNTPAPQPPPPPPPPDQENDHTDEESVYPGNTPVVKPEPIRGEVPPFVVFSILASGEYKYPELVEKYQSGLIAKPCRSIRNSPDVAIQWNSAAWPFVNPHGDITRMNVQQFLLTAQAAMLLSSGVSTFIPPSQVKLYEYIMSSLGSEIQFAHWEPGDSPILEPGTSEPVRGGDDDSSLAFMELGAGSHWPRGDYQHAVAPRFVWELDTEKGAYIDIMKSREGGVNVANKTFLERTAIQLISSRFKDVSCFSLAYAGIMAMKRNFDGEPVAAQHLLNPPIVVVVFDPWSVSFRAWRFKANVIWPHWKLERIANAPQTFWPDDRDYPVQSPTADIFMQVQDGHIYTMPPVDAWQKQGLCSPIVFKSGWRNWALTYGWVDDAAPRNRVFDGFITNFLTFRFNKPMNGQEAQQISVAWESGSIDGGEWRMCVSEASTNAFEYEGLMPVLLRARSTGLWRLPGGSPTAWALSRRFAFPIPPTSKATWGWDDLQQLETRRGLGETTVSKPDAVLVFARVWLFIPEYSAFWPINVRLDKIPRNWCIQRYQAQWSKDLYSSGVVITPFAAEGELRWPAIETVRAQFEKSGATAYPSNPEAYYNSDLFKWPGVSIADPVLPTNFWTPLASSNNNFWPLGWFEDVSKLNNNFLSQWHEKFG